MKRALLLFFLSSTLLAGCWVTPKEVRKKVKEYDEPAAASEPPAVDTALPTS